MTNSSMKNAITSDAFFFEAIEDFDMEAGHEKPQR
jgi:hypothetical protein